VGGLTWKSLPLTWVKFVIGRVGFDNKVLYGVIVLIYAFVHLCILKLVNFKKYHLLLVWFLPPIILGIITATILPVYSYFRVLFVLPAYLILLAIGLAESKKIHFPILLIVMQLIAIAIFWFSPRYHREDWRNLTRELPSGAVVAMPSRAQSAPLLYYGFNTPIIEPSHEELVGSEIYYVRYVEDLFDTSKRGQANFATSGYTISSERSYPGIAVDVYTK
jgi:hypothetical protein